MGMENEELESWPKNSPSEDESFIDDSQSLSSFTLSLKATTIYPIRNDIKRKSFYRHNLIYSGFWWSTTRSHFNHPSHLHSLHSQRAMLLPPQSAVTFVRIPSGIAVPSRQMSLASNAADTEHYRNAMSLDLDPVQEYPLEGSQLLKRDHHRMQPHLDLMQPHLLQCHLHAMSFTLEDDIIEKDQFVGFDDLLRSQPFCPPSILWFFWRWE